ncbi:hypothetical protein RSOLAG22IIIB_06520 [Rhizoctonia solani]|uniref:Uncharacterized protein n=1 Tax=Rhizoctonia solani TaxID=456999 RepID=A0A0K6GFH8_9AGAM|nr:hypothetical protein RSOLAG22IIIB_06520 [Rhizoctonia solani]
MIGLVLTILPAIAELARAQYTATYLPNNVPAHTEEGQIGTNHCGTGNSQTSLCQNLYINSVEDFCLWAPPYSDGKNSSIGEVEQIVVSWCVQKGYGTRLIPDGTIKGAHFVQTPDYVQVTGWGDFTKLNIPKGDAGGNLTLMVPMDWEIRMEVWFSAARLESCSNTTNGQTSCLPPSSVFAHVKTDPKPPRHAITFTISWAVDGICPETTIKECLKTALGIRLSRWVSTDLRPSTRETHRLLSHIPLLKVVRVPL